MWKYILFLYIASLFNLHAQTRNQGFMSLNRKYEFNIPQLGVGLTLPAHAGFMVPLLDGKEVALDVNDKTYYYLNPDYLGQTQTNKFFFSATNDPTDVLQLDIYPFDLEKYKTFRKAGSKDGKVLKRIKTNISTGFAFSLIAGESTQEVYSYFLDDYLFLFFLDSASANKTAHKKIIKSFGKRKLWEHRRRYETRVAYGYYENENKHITDHNTEHPYRRITGKSLPETEINIPMYQLSIQLPEGCYYEFHGRKIVPESDNNLTLNMDMADIVENPMHFYWLRGKGISFMGRYSDKKSTQPVNFNTMGQGLNSYYVYTKEIQLIIDGIEAEGRFYGSRESGDLHIWFETEEGYHSFTISGLHPGNISSYDPILSGIKINSGCKRKGNYLPLSELLDFKPKSPIYLDTIDLPHVTDVIASEGFSCYFPVMDIHVWLPDKPEDYQYGVNTTWGEFPLENNGMLVEVDFPPGEEHTFLHIRSTYREQGVNIGCTFYPAYGNDDSIEEMTKEYVRNLAGFTDAYPMTYDKATVFKEKDGTEVGVIIQNDQTFAILLVRNEEYICHYQITDPTKEKLMRLVALFMAHRGYG
ncbi:MAG: hypothetical protein LUG98_14455 [Tannerellaceae bacterium]|nr:hypothetical protein [Tannerellaceae bacterium]